MSTVSVTEDGRTAARRASSSAWAWSGAVAGLAGVVAIQASMGMGAAYDESTAGNAPAIAEAFAGERTPLLVMHLSLMVSTVLLLIFAAGLQRRLRIALPEDSLLPSVAAFGLLLTATAGLLGAGLDTELLFGLGEPGQMVAEFAVVGAHWVGTIPWLWVGAGVSGLAVAAASLRHGATPRWLGWASVVLGGLTVLLGISPLQYMAGFVGPVWVLVAGIGFAVSDRARR
ncbi:hypothetical protein ACWDT5_13770 [Rhodococcus aetherivorans]|uniref:hypothetical protein n=1 Tax=Rhodococcus TaxID=1827 RepID=UPI00045CE8F5|nr:MULTISPECIES: hypothetical protein [Rhodococcus]NCL78467.1 hypothetical protein [Rhodococcus sp. YH1]ANZ27106.1 hypothetical protein A4U64_22275 [Rhodococcus sp. WB1]KDE10181.1 membrane protein [Rhodococcus aetherivorans]QIX48539.1 hypothetical protein HFP48_02510 [Rhodococcus sp. DMU1]WFS12218.1 hypothetical protein P9K37_20900 [Rhodococcus aetherivorans]